MRPSALYALGSALLLACSVGATAGETDRLVEVLELGPGSRVADVGAGDGQWAVRLAERVGPDGRVFATEVDREELEEIRERVAREGLDNLTVVEASQTDTGLAAGCCDALLLRMVYHHFTEPELIRRLLFEALRPGGRLAVVDILPQTHWRRLPDVPDRGGHGIPPENLIAELESTGFRLLARYDDWNGDEDRYCVVFVR